MEFNYKPRGVCSRMMRLKIANGIIEEIEIIGGCDGNLKGICALAKGRKAKDVIGMLEGIHCGAKNTSCPDQLAKALQQAIG